MFTRQHYSRFADYIRHNMTDREQARIVAENAARLFQLDSVQFRPELFVKACGLENLTKSKANSDQKLRVKNAKNTGK